jgi:hypothetical protein
MLLVGSWVAVSGLVGPSVVSDASAVTAPRTVALHLTVNGSGTVRVPGNPAFTCQASFRTSSHCRHTFQVRKGRRIVLKESPASGWKLWKWTGACHGSAASCSLRVKARRFGFVTASFVPPGDRLNPYPLGRAVDLGDGWRLEVNSATINADAEVEAVTDQYGDHVNPPPPAGAQYTLVNVSMTYTGGGSASLGDYLYSYGNLDAEGAGNAPYQVGYCTPPPVDLSAVGQVLSGQTETGNLCYEIASDDASTLLLSGTAFVNWFALR